LEVSRSYPRFYPFAGWASQANTVGLGLHQLGIGKLGMPVLQPQR